MKESMKQSSQSFLDKFKGKATKVSKHGINHLLNQKPQLVNKQRQNKSLDSSRQTQAPYIGGSFEKMTPVIENQKGNQAKRLEADMEELFSSNPGFAKGRKVVLRKLANIPPPQVPLDLQNILQPNLNRKQRFLPPLNTPQRMYKRTASSTNKTSDYYHENPKHDSQSISISSQKKSKYNFGKYLKLNQDAMKHFQFLKSIEQKILFRDTHNKIKDKVLSM